MPVADDDGIVELDAELVLQPGITPEQRIGGPRHERDRQLPGTIADPACVGPFGSQVFIAENRNRARGTGDDTADLLKEVAPRVQLLTPLIIRVLALLSDRQDAIHGQRVTAEGQRFGNAAAQPDPVCFSQFPAHVVVMDLVDV
jgi:hypothetical protein